jgi:hypothetical protein
MIAAPIAVGIASKLPIIGTRVNSLGKTAMTAGLMSAPLVNKELQIAGVTRDGKKENCHFITGFSEAQWRKEILG